MSDEVSPGIQQTRLAFANSLLWTDIEGSIDVKYRMVGKIDKFNDVVNLRLEWLGYVLHSANHHLSRRTILVGKGVGWKEIESGQIKAWSQSINPLIVGLKQVGR